MSPAVSPSVETRFRYKRATIYLQQQLRLLMKMISPHSRPQTRPPVATRCATHASTLARLFTAERMSHRGRLSLNAAIFTPPNAAANRSNKRQPADNTASFN